MTPAEASQLLQRARHALRSGAREKGEAVATSPVSRYLDAQRAQAEQRLLRRWPQPVIDVQSLSAPGAWWAGELLGVPLLLTRDADGRARAFVNVCRHRGARVVTPGCGADRQRFSCPYHAWTYGADGALTGLPAPDGFEGLARATLGLQPLALAEAAGLIWVVADAAAAATDVRASLQPFATELSGLGFDTHAGYAPRTRDLACDWKLIVEGSSEAYHFKIAHRDSIAPMFAENLQLVDDAGPHRRMTLVKESLRTAPEDAALREHANLLYHFFPGTLILVQPDHAQVTRLEPLGPGRTRIHDLALVPQAPHTESAQRHWDRNVAIYRRALDEDYAQMESVQAGLASGANRVLHFGRHEFALARFNARLDAELAVPA